MRRSTAADQIKQLILTRGLAPGDSLPRRNPNCARHSMSRGPRFARRSAHCQRSTSSTCATATARSWVGCRSIRWSRRSSSAGCSDPAARSTPSERSSRSAWRSTLLWPIASSKAPRTATFRTFRHSSMRWSTRPVAVSPSSMRIGHFTRSCSASLRIGSRNNSSEILGCPHCGAPAARNRTARGHPADRQSTRRHARIRAARRRRGVPSSRHRALPAPPAVARPSRMKLEAARNAHHWTVTITRNCDPLTAVTSIWTGLSPDSSV